MPADFLLLTAAQCAARRRQKPDEWIAAVRQGDAPAPLAFIDGQPRWADFQVPRPPRKKRGPYTRAPKPAQAPAPDDDGLWNAARAARHCGLALSTFLHYARTGRAPAPATGTGRAARWDPEDVRPYAAARKGRAERPLNIPDTPLWTARQCADYHGVSPRTWHSAVSHGDAPHPVEKQGKHTPLWSAMAVRSLTLD
ncbi:hypothetical protein [Streptomyces griseoaurantiacus]|uniref:hypothetical protein n=1 Tax=Streptomyces griseoaurantiacus TaxID=68213 RepID=UPI00367650E7